MSRGLGKPATIPGRRVTETIGAQEFTEPRLCPACTQDHLVPEGKRKLCCPTCHYEERTHAADGA